MPHVYNLENIIFQAPPSHDRVAQFLAQPNPQHLPEPRHGPATTYNVHVVQTCLGYLSLLPFHCFATQGQASSAATSWLAVKRHATRRMK